MKQSAGVQVVRRVPRMSTLPFAVAALILAAVAVASCTSITITTATDGNIHRIKHVVIIMQENRSFDNYFGTFPGADGIPMKNDFLNGQRLDPKTDGRPDPRPSVRENAKVLGNLISDFDFSQKPRPPLILSIHPKTDLLPPIKNS